jgi:Rrf2 family protein
MLITRASEYAFLALTIIAKEEKPIDTDKLSIRLDISRSFLAKILQSLARAGILQSYKGAHGGFALAKEATEIRVSAIIYAAEKKDATVFDCSHDETHCPNNRGEFCKIWPFLNTLQLKIDTILESITLQDILDG